MIDVPYFGAIERSAETYVRCDALTVNGRTAPASLSVQVSLEPANLVALLGLLPELDASARAQMADRLAAGETTVVEFLDFHLRELPELKAQHGDRASVLAHLQLGGVGIWGPVDGMDGEPRIVLDYTVGRSISDQLLCVKFSAQGTLLAIAHES